MKAYPLGAANLVAGLAGVASSLWASHRAQRSQVSVDAAESFPTWKGEMPLVRAPAFRIGGRRRMAYRRRRAPGIKRGMSSFFKTFVRTSGIGTITASTGIVGLNTNVTLSQVQTTDLTAVYRLYRIKKVVLHLAPRLDSAQAVALTTTTWANSQNAFASFACDPEGNATAASSLTQQIVTAYDNSYSKWIASGDKLRYTFYPKAVNTVDVSGAATAAGSYSTNPWLQLNSTGITVPHKSILGVIQTGTTSTQAYDYYFEFHFQVKGIA